MTGTGIDQFLVAVRAFQDATAHLSGVWEAAGVPADIFGDSYPRLMLPDGQWGGLPDFAVFAAAVEAMQAPPPPDMPAHDPPAVGATAITVTAVDREPWFTVPAGWVGTVTVVECDRIEVRMDRYLGPGGHEHDNALLCSADHVDPDAPWRAWLSYTEAAAVGFHEHFRVLG